MIKTGTAIERSPEELLGDPSSGAMPVEVVPAEIVDASEVALAQQAHTRRAEVASQVLSLLGSLGNLALRIVELRGSSSSASVDSAAQALPTVLRATSREPRAASARRSGGRGRRQRRHRRGVG
ncbi:MAG: hypothetical protein J7M39_05670 [Anaerolineae bacterium]|nr:hypothetical protein [Anaerolineae bacterium]